MDIKEINDMAKDIFISILDKYKSKVENMEHYLELEEITTDMIMELKKESMFSVVSFDDYIVRDMVKNIIEFDEKYKDYPIDEDRMTWITRQFHDTYYDYDGIMCDVKKAMEYTRKYYEKSNYTKEEYTMKRLEDSTVQELGVDTEVNIIDVIKTEERMCYDAWWIFKTNLGYFRLKTYDGISENEMRNKCNCIKTIGELNDIQPKCFYYD